MTRSQATLVLRGVFEHLRRHGVPLGVRDYLEGVRALRAGHGITGRDGLRRLCEALWARREEESRLIRLLLADLPLPSPERVNRVTGLAPDAAAPSAPARDAAANSETLQPIETLDQPEQVSVEFLPTEEPAGYRIPRAQVPAARAESYILTQQPVIPQRDLIIAWRRYRRSQRTGALTELDLDATVEDRCRRGYAIAPVLVPRRRNQARLTVLVDVSLSMLAWKSFVPVLVDSLSQSQLADWAVYYFRNTPGDLLHADAQLLRPVPLRRALKDHQDSALLVFSDAGAARGTLRPERLAATRSFLAATQAQWSPKVWLNPMPRARWRETSAQALASMPAVSMVELSGDGVVRAVDLLRGYEVR